MLTNLSGFGSYPLTRNLVKRTSQVVNCLKKMQPMKDSPEKRALGITVWRQVRIITSMVVVVDKTNASKAKTLINNSRLSFWVTEDVARVAQFIRNSNMQSLFEDIQSEITLDRLEVYTSNHVKVLLSWTMWKYILPPSPRF